MEKQRQPRWLLLQVQTHLLVLPALIDFCSSPLFDFSMTCICDLYESPLWWGGGPYTGIAAITRLLFTQAPPVHPFLALHRIFISLSSLKTQGSWYLIHESDSCMLTFHPCRTPPLDAHTYTQAKITWNPSGKALLSKQCTVRMDQIECTAV